MYADTVSRCRRLALAGFALLSAAVPFRAAHAQAPGEPSAVIARDCDRECLIGIARRYMDALAHKDPSRAPLSRQVRFTENDVEMPIGDGLWGSISGVAATGLEVADATTGNAAWFGTVEEHGQPAYYAMRIRVRDGQIIDVETVVDRNTGLPAPFGDPAQLVHDPAFGEVLPEPRQRARERLIAVANGYFSTVELNDGQLFTEFDPDCQRTENGVSTTRGSAGAAALAQGCEAQFKLGFYRINKRVRERRYPLVDTERGVVVATGFFDHANTFDTYTTTDGKEHKTFLKWPNSLSLMEAFKIRDGKIYRVEAVFTYVPYFLHSPWNDMPVDPRLLPAVSPAQRAGQAAPCDRDCLIGFADRYMTALLAKDEGRAPWGKVVKFTENGVPMMIGDGLWGTISAKSPMPEYAADPTTGNVSWFGIVEEHGAPAYYGMRLKVVDGRITESETLVDRKGNPGVFGDPAAYAPDAAEPPLPAAQRVSRAAMVKLVDGYFASLQANDGHVLTRLDPECVTLENGVSTTQGTAGAAAIAAGCEAQLKLGIFKPDDRVRDRRYALVDPERGIVVATAFIDRAARNDSYATTDGAMRPTSTKYPYSIGLIARFKIRDGRIYRIESVTAFLPYFLRSSWGP
jgi:ketosteroid isomerase-like protein